jgi:hypothetical protein
MLSFKPPQTKKIETTPYGVMLKLYVLQSKMNTPPPQPLEDKNSNY